MPMSNGTKERNGDILSLICIVSIVGLRQVTSFTVPHQKQSVRPSFVTEQQTGGLQNWALASLRSSFDDEFMEEDPMAEWRAAYPDLEFVDYGSPEYRIDQGEEMFNGDETEVAIEEMREERRRKNDEFQFETYFRDVLQEGEEFKGEWTVYKASYDNLDQYGIPQLKQAKNILKVVSRANRIMTDPHTPWRVDGEHIEHEELIAVDEENDMTFASEILSKRYYPKELRAIDFRGPPGIMKVGNGHTICETVNLDEKNANIHEGPYSEMRTELGIHDGDIRLRLKLDYRTNKNDTNVVSPPLYLNTMIVCRERLNRWPRREGFAPTDEEISLFGPPGALGGLYDPPPVGTDEQAAQYLVLDLQGGATALFPYKIDQDENAFNGNGWVTTLDWAPGMIRFQVDRKVFGGRYTKGLKTLELTEVETEAADMWRPRDGGVDMRQ